MATNTSITLGKHWVEFIKTLLRSGRYGSTSEVIRDSLRLLEDREAKLQALRAALVEGEESGHPQPYDHKQFLAEMKQKHGKG